MGSKYGWCPGHINDSYKADRATCVKDFENLVTKNPPGTTAIALHNGIDDEHGWCIHSKHFREHPECDQKMREVDLYHVVGKARGFVKEIDTDFNLRKTSNQKPIIDKNDTDIKHRCPHPDCPY